MNTVEGATYDVEEIRKRHEDVDARQRYGERYTSVDLVRDAERAFKDRGALLNALSRVQAVADAAAKLMEQTGPNYNERRALSVALVALSRPHQARKG